MECQQSFVAVAHFFLMSKWLLKKMYFGSTPQPSIPDKVLKVYVGIRLIFVNNPHGDWHPGG